MLKTKKTSQIFLPEFEPELLKGIQLTGYEDPGLKRLLQAQYILQRGKLHSTAPLLPLLLSLRGKPYTLERHFPFETFFRTRIARRTLFKCGRQVGKSASLCARGLIQSNCMPWFSTLYIAPLFEQIRRLSQNYMRPLIENSPIRQLFMSADTVNSVLQRTFRNNSQMIFSFAYLDADRTRGISANKICIDECQDIDRSLIPIIRESMSGSTYGDIEEYACTPKSLENCAESLWLDSSQAEWAMKCVKCGHWNIPSLTHDLDKMLGPDRDDISMEDPGVICARCRQRRSIFPHAGRWLHRKPALRWDFAGYHIPQLIMPLHYSDSERFSALLAKRAGRGNTPANVFYNEVCGESYDSGSRIITMTELRRAAILPWECDLEEVKNKVDLNSYIHRVLAVDWGGGGETGKSYTAMAVLGMLPDGRIDCIWGHRSLRPHEHEREARMCLAAVSRFYCHHLVHDYSGAGSLRETFITQAGFPLDRIVNASYVRTGMSAKVMTFRPATKQRPRPWYSVDKTRSLLLVCNQIKTGQLRFFQWDYRSAEDPGLIYDFLALVDEKTASRLGTDVYTIIRDPAMTDDFAQAVNIGCCTLWNAMDKWPDLAAVAAARANEDILEEMQPTANDLDWDLPYYVSRDTLRNIQPKSKEPLQEF